VTGDGIRPRELKRQNILANHSLRELLLPVLEGVFNLLVEREAEGRLSDSLHNRRCGTFVKRFEALGFDDVPRHVHDFSLHWWTVIGLQSVDLQYH
jgi:hypothetical protein